MYDRLTVGESAKEIALMAETIKKIIDFDDELVDEQVLKDACYGKTESNVYKELVDYQLSLKKTIDKKEETDEENKEIKDYKNRNSRFFYLLSLLSFSFNKSLISNKTSSSVGFGSGDSSTTGFGLASGFLV